MPARILDLYAELRQIRAGVRSAFSNGLLGALGYFGLDGLAATEKKVMQELSLRGGAYTSEEKQALLAYCQTDVDALAQLLPVMWPQIDGPRALLRGRYLPAVARMEFAGVPIDVAMLRSLEDNWYAICGRLIGKINKNYGVYVPTGQRPVNPASALGSAVLAMAREWNIDAYRLMEAADMIWRQEREITGGIREAHKAARKQTGLTPSRIARWEDSGRDHSTYPGLDTAGRELAGAYPELGIGRGHSSDDGEDDTDYAGSLWDVLRDEPSKPRPKHDPDILSRAAQLVSDSSDDLDSFRPMSFSQKRFREYLIRKQIPWPQKDDGALDLDDEAFREMAKAYPREIGPLRDVRYTLSQMKLRKLTVGTDGRNRCLLSPFGSKTGRNQPSNSKYIFGPSTWFRSLIKPEVGRALAYIDWSQQELAIAAYLSGDRKMQEAYVSGDFYLTFAKMAGTVPPDGTKATHATERNLFKAVALGVLYGLSSYGLARKLSVPDCRGRELLQLHRETFRQFWKWSDQIEAEAMLGGTLRSAFGWQVRADADPNPRSFRNFPMQANGAEMMRLACCLATERGITVCAPVHDALLIEDSSEDIDDAVRRTEDAMQKASELVLPRFPLRTEAEIVRYPDRYSDERGEQMWEVVCSLLEGVTLAVNCRGV
jgi:hypothetical protein